MDNGGLTPFFPKVKTTAGERHGDFGKRTDCGAINPGRFD
jgi:hypothetical protein